MRQCGGSYGCVYKEFAAEGEGRRIGAERRNEPMRRRRCVKESGKGTEEE